MPRYPKGSGDGRYRTDAGRPDGQNDTAVCYYSDLAVARAACVSIAARSDVCRGIVVDTVDGREVGHVVHPDRCVDCKKCPGLARDDLPAKRA